MAAGSGVIVPAVGPPIDIDVVVRETHTYSNTVTDHPAERGVNFSDHVRPEPDTVQLECLITNTPVDVEQQVRALISSPGSEDVTDAASTVQSQIPVRTVTGRAAAAYRSLNDLRAAAQLVQIFTTLGTYAQMVVTSLSLPRDSKNFDALEFTIGFKFVRIVDNKFTKVVKAKDPKVGAKKKEGEKTPRQNAPPKKSLGAAAEDLARSGSEAVSGAGAALAKLQSGG